MSQFMTYKEIMKIYTSYYARIRQLPENVIPISIAISTPKFYSGLVYKKLAPTYDILNHWKAEHNIEDYIKQFEKILQALSVEEVIKDLFVMGKGNDVALICYEKPTDFCHRHLVADWLTEQGYPCEEFIKENKINDR